MSQIGRLYRLGQQLAIRTPPIRQTMAINAIQVRYRVNPNNPGIPYPREGIEETEEELDQRYIKYFSKPDIDGWEVRKGINDMHGMDLIPEPKIMIEVLKACRRVNDHSLAVRYLEAVFRKACNKPKIVDYLIQEIEPTLKELGVSLPAELGYNKPELALGDPWRTPLIERGGYSNVSRAMQKTPMFKKPW